MDRRFFDGYKPPLDKIPGGVIETLAHMIHQVHEAYGHILDYKGWQFDGIYADDDPKSNANFFRFTLNCAIKHDAALGEIRKILDSKTVMQGDEFKFLHYINVYTEQFDRQIDPWRQLVFADKVARGDFDDIIKRG